MRVSTATLCTLAALAAGDLSETAIAHSAPAEPHPDSSLRVIQSLPPSESEAIASATPRPTAPDTVEAVRFSPNRHDEERGGQVPPGVDSRLPQPPTLGTSESPESSEPTEPQILAESQSAPVAAANPLFVPNISLEAIAQPERTASSSRALGGSPSSFTPAAVTPAVAPVEERAIGLEAPAPTSFSAQDLLTQSVQPESVGPTLSSVASSVTNSETNVAASPVDSPETSQAPTPTSNPPSDQEIEELRRRLNAVQNPTDFGDEYAGSPAITISNPTGFGADNFTVFLGFSYQSRLRFTDEGDATAAVGVGLGDAREAVGLQLSYTLASFGTKARDFGTGGFNAKIHHRFPGGTGIAVGWEGFATTGNPDFRDTVYGVVSQIIRTTDDINRPFSRVALTAGLGNGRFRTEEDVTDDRDTVNGFASIAVRVVRPVSAVVEWTGQDLALGLSITPVRNLPWVITPAIRDIAGAGDGARFVIGTGISFQF